MTPLEIQAARDATLKVLRENGPAPLSGSNPVLLTLSDIDDAILDFATAVAGGQLVDLDDANKTAGWVLIRMLGERIPRDPLYDAHRVVLWNAITALAA